VLVSEGLRSRQKADRRKRLLDAAARLFAERGFHGVSIEDLGAAADISGPAVYRHFPNKDAVLSALLVGVSERLLAGGQAEVATAVDDAEALRRLVSFHTDFALSEPELISVQGRDLSNLSPDVARRVRRLQREYLEVWVGVLTRRTPGLSLGEARTRAHAVFGLLNSTPHVGADVGTGLGTGSRPGSGSTSGFDHVRRLLEQMALGSLLSAERQLPER
jgi:AcrR family transcriptional regulator